MKLPASWVLLVLLASGVAHAQAVIEDYVVNAQYRGEIKKGFRDLGRGKASYESVGGSGFKVKMKGEVSHPDGTSTYSFTLIQSFQLEGNNVRLAGTEKKEMNAAAAPHEAWIVELVPFAYLARRLPVPNMDGGGGETSRTLRYAGQTFTLNYAKSERQIEVSMLRNGDLTGKFFFAPGAPRGFASLEKFRMWFPKAKIMITFAVSKTTGTI